VVVVHVLFSVLTVIEGQWKGMWPVETSGYSQMFCFGDTTQPSVVMEKKTS